MFGRSLLVAAVLLATALGIASSDVRAEEVVRFATSKAGWDNSVITLGKQAGYFSEVGIEVEISFTNGSSEALQAAIAGGVDVAVVSVPLFLGAIVKGAPVKMISANFTGASDLLWYARSDSSIKKLKDVTKSTKLGYATPGSSNYIILSALLEQYAVGGELIATGSPSATMIQVMAGQIDVGYDGNGGLGVPEFESGAVRVIGLGSELTLMQKVTTRGLVVTAETLAKRRDVLTRFLQAYQKTIDWMYRDPAAVQQYAEMNDARLEDAKRVVQSMYPERAMQLGDVGEVEVSIAQGLAFKRISQRPTAEQLAAAFDIIWKPAPR
jgi:NitT/TauT family transport system substrate-binding protein